jgi:hypothetical protein
MHRIEVLQNHLRDYRSKHLQGSLDCPSFLAALAEIRSWAVARGDERLATKTWICRQVHSVHEDYLKAFAQLKAGKYYDAWCSFEQVEIGLSFLEPHESLDENPYGLRFIRGQVKRFQKLFPYRVFLSPAWLLKERRCSICNAKRLLRTRCRHEVGQIYGGEICLDRVTVAELLELSVVDDPVQKYSVMFLKREEEHDGGDGYDYSLLAYLAEALESPFAGWRADWTTKRHPHDRFTDVRLEEPCPCKRDLSRSYLQCCFKEEGVLRPHLMFGLEEAPPAALPKFRYPEDLRGQAGQDVGCGEEQGLAEVRIL